MSKWQKLRQLSWSERWLLLLAMIVLPVTAVGLRLFGLKRWRSALARLAPLNEFPEKNCAEKLAAARATARLVKIAAARGPYRANCLQRSLGLWWLLRRGGIASDLRIGMQRENGQVKGHAWIECNGVVLNDAEDVAGCYTAFPNLEGVL